MFLFREQEKMESNDLRRSTVPTSVCVLVWKRKPRINLPVLSLLFLLCVIGETLGKAFCFISFCSLCLVFRGECFPRRQAMARVRLSQICLLAYLGLFASNGRYPCACAWCWFSAPCKSNEVNGKMHASDPFLRMYARRISKIVRKNSRALIAL